MQARLLETPSLLQNVSDEINCIEKAVSSSSSSTTESGALVPSPSRHNLKPSRCSCRPSTYSLRFPFRNANLSSSALIHGENCDLFKYPEKENAWHLRFVYCGRLVAQAITASIHLRRGAGGFSISSKLNCSRAVPLEDSIFSTIHFFLSRLSNESGMRLEPNSLIKLIEGEFQNGKASPHDVDESGNTLLHVSYLS